MLVHGKNRQELQPLLDALGIQTVDRDPALVISYGGDGTLLGSESLWPGVPKVALRDSDRCHTCSHDSNEVILRHLVEGRLKRTEFLKLKAKVGERELTCINDVIVNKTLVNAGLRYEVEIDGEPYGRREIVADGLIVSTPFGSGAYYRSITNSVLRVGIGLAFNNTTEPINHLVISEGSQVCVKVTRGPAVVAADNNPDLIPMSSGESVIIEKADHNAVILSYDYVRYPADQFIFHDLAVDRRSR